MREFSDMNVISTIIQRGIRYGKESNFDILPCGDGIPSAHLIPYHLRQSIDIEYDKPLHQATSAIVPNVNSRALAGSALPCKNPLPEEYELYNDP